LTNNQTPPDLNIPSQLNNNDFMNFFTDKIDNMVLPDKPKLKFLEKFPNLKQAKKEMKKLRVIQEPAKSTNTISEGQYETVSPHGSQPGPVHGWRDGCHQSYVTPVKCGRLVVEVTLSWVRWRLCSKKWPRSFLFQPRFVVSRERMAALYEEQAEQAANKQNPWTFQRIARSNMLGIHNVLSLLDIQNHGCYTGKFFDPFLRFLSLQLRPK
uniref:Uncharacterized protein n=1 Tax=Cyprinus carpio TaxID=7962 RepID=A0A8C1WQV0_CYPCA